MTPQIALVLGLLATAVILFALEWISIDITTLLLLSVLVLAGILTPQQAFSGFASEIIVILCAIFILSEALMKTGVMDSLAVWIARAGGDSPTALLIVTMGATALVSAFMNNTTATAMFLPLVLTLCKRGGIDPGRMLIPLAFASILGGTCTLIGTSTNVAVSGYIQTTGLPPFTLFEFAGIGLVLVVTGMLYMATLGKRFLPSVRDAGSTGDYSLKEYMTEVVLIPGSQLAGLSIREAPFGQMGLTVLEVIRGEGRLFPEPSTKFQDRDVLIVKGSRESLLEVKEFPGVRIKAEAELSDQALKAGNIKIVEAILMPQSGLIGRTIKELNFRQRFGVTALAIYRKGHALAGKLGQLPLQVGDVLLLQGQKERFAPIWGNPDLWVLEEIDHVLYRKRKGTYVLLAFLGALVAAAAELIPLSIAFLLAALVTALLKCLSLEEAYKFIDWRLIILIGGMTSFGLAMEKTGASAYMAAFLIDTLSSLGVHFVLAGFVLLTILLTQPLSNAAAALVVLPVAISAAEQLGANPRAFAATVALSASLSFLTPFEPSCLLVYGPGKYRFRDFVVSGLPLTLLDAVLLLLLVPLFWPLQ